MYVLYLIFFYTLWIFKHQRHFYNSNWTFQTLFITFIATFRKFCIVSLQNSMNYLKGISFKRCSQKIQHLHDFNLTPFMKKVGHKLRRQDFYLLPLVDKHRHLVNSLPLICLHNLWTAPKPKRIRFDLFVKYPKSMRANF